MPYKNNKDLPERVRKHLPQGAQTIFRKAFNKAFEKYEEVTVFKVAWSAVKRVYHKDLSGKWVK